MSSGLARPCPPGLTALPIKRSGVSVVWLALLGAGTMLAAPTMYDHAWINSRPRILRRMLTGELTLRQLFQRAGRWFRPRRLQATAERDGDEWVINKQKVQHIGRSRHGHPRCSI
ncbi:MAG: hypothetical protein R2706_08365 [Acidimicrobiales bacterium]